ncbi:MAG: hypothetical protein JNG90_01695 [Planctomycetaceae bacterium]|nr:hypothetical protein [Planctomycetaceae bacterium]
MGTDAIRDRFPPGLSRPALRALQAAGFARLEQLVRISESELAELHGIGPRAVVALRAALRDQGLAFRAAKPGRGTARH